MDVLHQDCFQTQFSHDTICFEKLSPFISDSVLVYWKPHQSLLGTFFPLWIVLQSFWVVCFPIGRNFSLNPFPNSQAQVSHYAEVVWTFSTKSLPLVVPGSFCPGICLLSHIWTFLPLFLHSLKIYLSEQYIAINITIANNNNKNFCRIV